MSVSFEDAQKRFVHPPEDLGKKIKKHDAYKITNLFTRNHGDRDEAMFRNDFVDRPSPDVVMGLICTFLSEEQAVLTPEGELVDQKKLNPDYSPAVLAKKLQGWLKENEKVLTPSGEFVDADKVKVKSDVLKELSEK